MLPRIARMAMLCIGMVLMVLIPSPVRASGAVPSRYWAPATTAAAMPSAPQVEAEMNPISTMYFSSGLTEKTDMRDSAIPQNTVLSENVSLSPNVILSGSVAPFTSATQTDSIPVNGVLNTKREPTGRATKSEMVQFMAGLRTSRMHNTPSSVNGNQRGLPLKI